MANHKLILDDDVEEEFILIAIHCSEEAYKMAYLLNKQVSLQLRRREVDLDFSENGLDSLFPLFEFENLNDYKTYFLVANKHKSVAAHISSSGSLFGDEIQEDVVTTYLLPEHKKVDFFLKIISESGSVSEKKIVTQLNDIQQVISAYSIDKNSIKNSNNLIFD